MVYNWRRTCLDKGTLKQLTEAGKMVQQGKELVNVASLKLLKAELASRETRQSFFQAKARAKKRLLDFEKLSEEAPIAQQLLSSLLLVKKACFITFLEERRLKQALKQVLKAKEDMRLGRKLLFRARVIIRNVELWLDSYHTLLAECKLELRAALPKERDFLHFSSFGRGVIANLGKYD